MNIKGVLFAALASISIAAFASGDFHIQVGNLEGSTVINRDAVFKVHYSWLTDQARKGKISYEVYGTNCKGAIDTDQYPAWTLVNGDVEIKCRFDKITEYAPYASATALQLFDEGGNLKGQSDIQKGRVFVQSE